MLIRRHVKQVLKKSRLVSLKHSCIMKQALKAEMSTSHELVVACKYDGFEHVNETETLGQTRESMLMKAAEHSPSE